MFCKAADARTTLMRKIVRQTLIKTSRNAGQTSLRGICSYLRMPIDLLLNQLALISRLCASLRMTRELRPESLWAAFNVIS